MSTASAKPAPKKLRLDFTPSEMGMLMGITLRIPESELKAQWETLLKRIVYIEAPPAAERTALEKVRVLRERLDNWVRLFETANPGSPALRYTRQAWKVVRDEIDFRFPELDAQERAGAKAASEQGGAT